MILVCSYHLDIQVLKLRSLFRDRQIKLLQRRTAGYGSYKNRSAPCLLTSQRDIQPQPWRHAFYLCFQLGYARFLLRDLLIQCLNLPCVLQDRLGIIGDFSEFLTVCQSLSLQRRKHAALLRNIFLQYLKSLIRKGRIPVKHLP